MYKSFECLAVIPARAGSKGIRGKNIINLCGKPLLAYTAEAAKKSKYFDRIILSTDGADIAQVGREYGLEVPFMRPAHLAGDKVANPPVVHHVINFLEAEGFIPSIIVLLQPTCPLRTYEDIDNCIEKLVKNNCTSVMSIVKVPDHYSPHWQFTKDNMNRISRFMGGSLKDKTYQRQKLPPSYVGNGAVYAFWLETLLSDNSYYGDRCEGYEMTYDSSINIDEPEDLKLAEMYLREMKN